jgi:hypothetical protein
MLDGEKIMEVNEARYLGFTLNNEKINYAHLENRLSTFAAKQYQLNKCDFNKPEMQSRTKSIIYKAHLRPVLFYGLDCMNLNIGDIKNLYTTEGNTLKTIHNLFTGIHSTELFLALGLDTTINLIKLNRIKLFMRLFNCNYTRNLLEALVEESTRYSISNTIISDVMDIVGTDTKNLNSLFGMSKTYVCQAIKSLKQVKEEDETVVHIKHLLNNLPTSKYEIETILKSFEHNQMYEDQIDLNEIFTN